MTSGNDGPRGQKTVFQPSPLAARAAGAPPPPGGSSGALPAGFAPASASEAGAPGYTPRQASFLQDDVPPLSVPMRVRNPVMAAAARLLALAAAILAECQVAEPALLLQRASAEAKAFEKTLSTLGLSTEDNARARYAVLATIDDIVQNLPGGATSDWARQSLVVQSFGQAFGGDQFWNILDNMLARPAAYRELLEVYLACLAVGFQGRFRVSPDGAQQLQMRMSAIYAALADIRPRPENDLVPSWRGQPVPLRKVGWLMQAVCIGAALAGILIIAFVAMKLLLDSRDDAARLAIQQSLPATPATIARETVDIPAPPSTQFERVRNRIQSPCIEAFDDGATIRLVITACADRPGGLFDKGAAMVSETYQPLIEEAARALAPEPGLITIVAHTDSDPIKGMLRASYADNRVLSEARAINVRNLLATQFPDINRLTAEGRGDRELIDRSGTENAKARNRRVELIIPRSE